VSFSSGTAALHAAAFAAGLTTGDEAITTPMTFAATANCVLYQGATPVFADVCSDTLNIDPEQIAGENFFEDARDSSGGLRGTSCRSGRDPEIASDRGLIVIEDACHALGAKHRGRATGSIADMTVFSFHPVKHITTGRRGNGHHQ
jgi:perosamine synthetase